MAVVKLLNLALGLGEQRYMPITLFVHVHVSSSALFDGRHGFLFPLTDCHTLLSVTILG